MKYKVGQVWADDTDCLLIEEITKEDNRTKIKGTAVLNGVVANYTTYINAHKAELEFNRLVFDPVTY